MKKTESYFNLKPLKIIYLKAMCTFSNMVKSVPLMILQKAAAEKNSYSCLLSLTQDLLIWISLVF